MKRTSHSPEQVVTKLREADAMLGSGPSRRFKSMDAISVASNTPGWPDWSVVVSKINRRC